MLLNSSAMSSLNNNNNNNNDINSVNSILNNNKHAIMVNPKLTKTSVCCFTMSLNPTNNYILGVGCRDQWVRLYDRRTLTMSSNTHSNAKNVKPFTILTQHNIIHSKVCRQQLLSRFKIEYFDSNSNAYVTYFPYNVHFILAVFCVDYFVCVSFRLHFISLVVLCLMLRLGC